MTPAAFAAVADEIIARSATSERIKECLSEDLTDASMQTLEKPVSLLWLKSALV